jgi:quinol monooxygenase YgiN
MVDGMVNQVYYLRMQQTSPMYIIRVALRVRQDALEPFIAQANREVAEVPHRFEGCERYAFYTGLDDPRTFLLYEEWRDQASFEAYRNSEYFAEIGQRIRPLLDGMPDSAYFTAERAGTPVA